MIHVRVPAGVELAELVPDDGHETAAGLDQPPSLQHPGRTASCRRLAQPAGSLARSKAFARRSCRIQQRKRQCCAGGRISCPDCLVELPTGVVELLQQRAAAIQAIERHLGRQLAPRGDSNRLSGVMPRYGSTDFRVRAERPAHGSASPRRGTRSRAGRKRMPRKSRERGRTDSAGRRLLSSHGRMILSGTAPRLRAVFLLLRSNRRPSRRTAGAVRCAAFPRAGRCFPERRSWPTSCRGNSTDACSERTTVTRSITLARSGMSSQTSQPGSRERIGLSARGPRGRRASCRTFRDGSARRRDKAG